MILQVYTCNGFVLPESRRLGLTYLGTHLAPITADIVLELILKKVCIHRQRGVFDLVLLNYHPSPPVGCAQVKCAGGAVGVWAGPATLQEGGGSRPLRSTRGWSIPSRTLVKRGEQSLSRGGYIFIEKLFVSSKQIVSNSRLESSNC